MIILFLKKRNEKKKYFFTERNFILDAKFPHEFDTLSAAIKTARKFKSRIPAGYQFHYEKLVKKITRKMGTKTKTAPKRKTGSRRKTSKKETRKNPREYSRESKIKKAIENFEAFTGHSPEYIDKNNLPKFDVGFKVGECDGILYTTVRDGRTEQYIHKFKKRARPILAVNFDGSSIALIGGHYRFTERGIVDT